MRNRLLSAGLASFALVSVIGGLAAAWAGNRQAPIDQRVERACHHAVGKRVPLGYRDIETVSYDQATQTSTLVKGRIMARYGDDEWIDVDWTCDIHPKSNQIKRIQVMSSPRRIGPG
jgi:hypothetical protein